jgi:hypothetical protein
MNKLGGKRPGAGRKRRKEPKSRPIWCGQMSEVDRQFILDNTTPADRFRVLIAMATCNYEGITDT